MSSFKIKGKVAYQNIGTGFWGIVGSDNQKWKPMNMPENLKKEGKEVEITAEKAEAGFSVFMWGTTIKILDYHN